MVNYPPIDRSPHNDHPGPIQGVVYGVPSVHALGNSVLWHVGVRGYFCNGSTSSIMRFWPQKICLEFLEMYIRSVNLQFMGYKVFMPTLRT